MRYKGRTYCFTWLRFGLSAASKVMTKVFKTVLEMVTEMNQATISYADDIFVEECVVTVKKIAIHLKKFGLTAKPLKAIERCAALGFKIERDKRGNENFENNQTYFVNFFLE